MAFVTPSKTQTRYDAIVVGSGAAGGMAAYVLSKAGLKVLMLEAGRNYDPLTETPMFEGPADAPLRGVGTVDKPNGYFDATVNGGWKVPGEPYLTQKAVDDGSWVEGDNGDRMKPTQSFMWWRARMLGGRTNHWGRVSLRMGPYDFKPRSRDGLGVDWPIGYEEVAPYYDKTEALIGVFGSNEGLENVPDSPAGILQPPPQPRAYELLMQRACKGLGIPMAASRMAILTQALNGRAACFYATPCGRGCAIKANFQSTTVLIPPALETGNLDIVTDAMVREVTLDKSGKASGVHYIDKATGKEMHAAARSVILGASACESARILLNSKSALFPNGLANNSGHVGRHLTDSTGGEMSGQIPALENSPSYNEDGVSGFHLYIPWWLHKEALEGKLGFPRGYYIGHSGGRQMPSMGLPSSIGKFTGGLYGQKLKEETRRYFGTFVSFHARGEMIPNEHSYCEVDPDKKDQWGIPVLRFKFKWSDHELNQAVHMQKTFASIITAMGGTPSRPPELNGARAITAGGSVNHEIGTTRMGAAEKDSVLNAFCQAWEVPNLLVTDGGPFASNPYKNPTLTILALTWRSCDYLIEEFKKGNI
ncbi:MAG: Glucose-methanol-choline oxidoreductase [Chthoniobacteraceae bacterium]|nr:Glucose-methanol-choline oxidoreductase [Chthoniobacteraceae bacterium]